MVSNYLLLGRQSIDLMFAFFVIFTSVCRPQTLPHVICILFVNVLFKICVAEWAYIIKIVNEPHSVNANRGLALVSVTCKRNWKNKETFNPTHDSKDLANSAKNNQQSLKLNIICCIRTNKQIKSIKNVQINE